MKKAIILIAIVCFIISIAVILPGCGNDGPEYRTYHKVYKDSNGNWQGTDVTYDSHVDGNPLLAGVVIVGVIILVAKSKKK